MGLRPNRSPAGDAAAQAAQDAQLRASALAERDRTSLLSAQLGEETRTRARRFGTRSLLAGTGGSGPLSSLASGASGKSGLTGSLFAGLAGLFGR